MTKKIYLETFEKCPRSLHFSLLSSKRLQDVFRTSCKRSSRRLQDVLENVKLLRCRRVEDVFRTNK